MFHRFLSRIGWVLYISVPISWAQERPIDYWAIEDAETRKKLPLYKTIPAAESHELTPSNGLPPRDAYVAFALPDN